MTRADFAWVGGAALALAAIIAAELAPAPATPPLPEIAVPAMPDSPAAQPVPAGSSIGAVATILARPLFAPSRRPPSAPATATAASLRLSGTIVGPSGRRAIFEPAGGGKPVVVRVGDRVGSEIVRAITPGTVLVVGADGPHLLAPAYTALTGRPAGYAGAGLPPAGPTMAVRLGEAK